MKRNFLPMLIMILFYSGAMAQSAGKSKYLKPTNFQQKVTLEISGKSRSYYALDVNKASMITIQGPGILKVLTRGHFKPGEIDKINYEIEYTVDGGEKKNVKFSDLVRSNDAKYEKGSTGAPGQLKKIEIELGRGMHNVELTMKENKIPVVCRYIFTPTKAKKGEWIAFCPMRPSEPVNLISREESVTYYRFSREKPLKVEVIGPTELRVLTRIENHYQMKGRVHYRVQIIENGKVINTYQLNSIRSEVAQYENDNELIPGKACEFVIMVPKGSHIYEIRALDEDKSTILGRFLLLKKDVKLLK